MHIHLRIHRWVVWWFFTGLVCGVIVVLNILDRTLTREQEDIVLAIGLINWVLGGFICYAANAVQVEKRAPSETAPAELRKLPDREREWHPASDFVQPGSRKRFLPPRF